MDMPPTITLELIDGVRVVVPDSLNLITPYVLSEQRDWFEDEIKFLRRLLQPGERMIDIGANCGVYALTMAKLVGPTGRVWAFEPAASTADLLAAGITANNFTHVELIRSALSSAPGTAQLSTNGHSELNELVRDERPAGATETVTLETLDQASVAYGWRDISFIKIDAEGEESNILRAGTRFLEAESPLIQYEIKASTLNLQLAARFAELGYRSFRLVPGLDLLVPFDANEPVDDYLLNLFCCKPDRAARLCAQGFLLEAAVDLPAPRVPDIRAPSVEFPYGALLAPEWAQRTPDRESASVDQALLYYARSRDTTLPPAERFAALTAGFRGLQRLPPTNLRLASLARVALAYGARAVAVKALLQLHDVILQTAGQVNVAEPFLAPAARFDTIPPGPRQTFPRWIAAATFEELERIQHFSSFYTGKTTQRRLEMIRDMGYSSDEMQRRLLLVQRRFTLAS